MALNMHDLQGNVDTNDGHSRTPITQKLALGGESVKLLIRVFGEQTSTVVTAQYNHGYMQSYLLQYLTQKIDHSFREKFEGCRDFISHNTILISNSIQCYHNYSLLRQVDFPTNQDKLWNGFVDLGASFRLFRQKLMMIMM